MPQRRSKPATARAGEGDEHIAARVKSRRVQLGMSQSELGRKVGVSFQQIQKYERGANRIGSSRLHQIAAALGVKPEYFFDNARTEVGRQSYATSVDLFDQFAASADGIALMRAFVKIRNKTVRRAIAKLVADLEE